MLASQPKVLGRSGFGGAEQGVTRPGPIRAVLKLGGEVVADAFALASVLQQVADRQRDGWRFAIVHGGGPQAGALQEQLGLSPHFVDGRRVTDAATLRVMKQAVAGEVSCDLVAAALTAGIDALGLSGVSGRLVAARRRPPAVGPDGTPVDFGLVGEVAQVRCELVESLWRAGLTPVINPLGIEGGPTPHVLNINADTVASAIAGALGVDHLFVVTAAGGVRSDPADPDSIVARLTASQARAAIANGTVTGGMVPKLQGALDLLDTGVAAIHIVGPRPGALAPAVPGGVAAGTVIVADSPADVAVSRGPLQHPGPG